MPFFEILHVKKAYLTIMSKMNSRSIKHLLDSVKSNTSMIDLSKKITALVDYVKKNASTERWH